MYILHGDVGAARKGGKSARKKKKKKGDKDGEKKYK